MDIHKPKAAHNWREFLTEIGTIVCGILIALGLEQAVEALHRRHLVEQAEEAMRTEIVDDDGPQAFARLAIAPCLSHELDELRAALDQRITPEAFGRLAASYNPPRRTWDEQAWRAAQSSGVLSAMGPKKLDRWSLAYVLIPGLGDTQRAERDALARLKLTRFRSGDWTQTRVDEVSDIIDNLQTDNFRITSAAASQSVDMKITSLQLPVAAQQTVIGQARRTYGSCVVQPDLAAVEALRVQISTPEQQGIAEKKLLGR
jgi:hypothetical protein